MLSRLTLSRIPHSRSAPSAALRPRARRARRSAKSPSLLAVLVGLCAIAVSSCGDTVQDQPIDTGLLERLVGRPYPIYWLGGVFHGLAITNIGGDPGGAYTIQYGDCTQGGQNTCVAPLLVVTSPDNSFRPGASTPHRLVRLRGVHAVLAQEGQTIEVPTGGVVVDIYANDPSLAREAAATMVPINRVGLPGGRLPTRRPDTGFANQPIPAQKSPAVGIR
jgi:hypothetical protein